MLKKDITRREEEWDHHLSNQLLPFWLDRSPDRKNGGLITHFDRNGSDQGTDEKSLISQARSVYSFSLAYREGLIPDRSKEAAELGYRFLMDRLRDKEEGGFFWMADRKGNITNPRKVLYGQSFAIYGLCEYFRAFGDPEALRRAQETADLILSRGLDLARGGFLEMFSRNWVLLGPGPEGGDRKTLDVHMHMMESFTSLVACGGRDSDKRHLSELIDLLLEKFYPVSEGIGVPQYYLNWERAPQIKFNIIWGWDRFDPDGSKLNSLDNGSYGHDMEFFWLLNLALKTLDLSTGPYLNRFRAWLDHSLECGLDREYGGIYVEGPAQGPASDLAKEFWQQAEAMIGFLEAYRIFGENKYMEAYANIHDFVFKKMITPDQGEWLPLLNREGEPVWTHLGTSWKINYHTLRSAVLCRGLLREILESVKEGSDG